MLLKGGCVLSLDKRVGNLRAADVLIADDRIAEVGSGLRARDAEVVDATDTIVMPGFVDAHRHTWMSLLRNLGTARPHAQATIADQARRYQPDDLYAATLLGLLSAVEVGITTVVDVADLPTDGPSLEAALQAHVDAGLRTVFVHAPPASYDAPGHAAARHDAAGHEADDGAGYEAALRRLAGDTTSIGPLTTLAVGPCDITQAGLETVAARWSLARELGLRIHAHTGTRPEDRGVVAALGARGALGDDVTLVHASHLDDDDLDAIAASGTRLAVTPASEMVSGRGTPPMQALVDRGIRPGLGVDDQLLSPGDLFAQMRAAQSVQHARTFDLKLAGKGGVPQLLGTREVIRYATVDGAAAAGLGSVTGTIAPGMAADLVLLRTDRPNIAPVNDPIGAVVWGMDASNVDRVVVAGRTLLRDGRLDADVDRIRRLALDAQRRHAVGSDQLVETGEAGAS